MYEFLQSYLCFITFIPSACKTVLLDTALLDEDWPFCEVFGNCLIGELLKCLGEEGFVFGASEMDDTDAVRLEFWFSKFWPLPLMS